MRSNADSREDTGHWREPSDPRGTRRPRFTGYPFTLGVASGAPEPTSVVLWTRLAPEPLADGGVGPGAVLVSWEMADDQRFERIVARGEVEALSARAHSVHVEVDGLSAGRWYWYRFIAGGEASPVGRTRTAPAPDAQVDRLRFGLGSCQQYEQGYFAAHRHLADEGLDLMLFVGDYVYESSWGVGLVRRHSGGEPQTLAEYRTRHAQYKTDPDLQRLHAAVPWLVTWDGYPAARDRLLETIEDAAAQSCRLVSGDAHTNYVCDLRRGEPASAPLATEFCGTSITSQGRPQEQTDEIRRDNPHIHLADSRQRGYVVFNVAAERCEARLRVLADVRDRATGVETLATFTVAAGRPGATRT